MDELITRKSPLLFIKFSQTKSRNFNRNPLDLEFQVRVKDFDIGYWNRSKFIYLLQHFANIDGNVRAAQDKPQINRPTGKSLYSHSVKELLCRIITINNTS